MSGIEAGKKGVSPTPADTTEAPAVAEKMGEDAATKESQSINASKAKETSETTETPTEATTEKPVEKTDDNSKDGEDNDVVMGEATDVPAAAVAEDSKAEGADAPAAPAGNTVTPVADKSKEKARRKSGAVPEHKGKKLNKKGSKARITNLDAAPGDHYLVKLKGYPPWPAIICDEDMLPHNLLSTRPVTARRTDGTYREDFADGGKRSHDRVFPVMYLHTNEFGWVVNTCLLQLSPEKASESINDRMRKDLQAAYQLASEGNDLDYYKEMLRQFQKETLAREEEAKEAKAVAEAAAKAARDNDLEMPDVLDAETPAKKSKKRKAESDAATPRVDSVKKPKIKITSSAAKAANGIFTPKTAKETAAPKASAKSKAKKPAEDKKAEATVSKEPEMTPEERHQRKEKEVLFLRHKLQKGLLTRDQEPKEEEMKLMSDYITKLEGFPELEVSIIRATKINKVLKAILKLDSIPKEDEFNFKTRSQSLLDKWNKLLADAPGAAPTTSIPANGINGVAGKKDKAGATKPAPTPADEENAPKSDKTTSEAVDKAETEVSEKEKKKEEKTEEPSDENKESKEVEALA